MPGKLFESIRNESLFAFPRPHDDELNDDVNDNNHDDADDINDMDDFQPQNRVHRSVT